MSLKISHELLERAKKIIPDCSQTFSKGPSQFVQGVAPAYIECGEGSHIWDVDGKEYIDFTMSLGPIILGHNYPNVTNAVKKILSKGAVFGIPHRSEVELSELLCSLIPCAEMVRFGKNGSDATSGSVRVARAYTGRDKIACCGYHGWQDWFIATTTRNKGVPAEVAKLTIPFTYNNIETLRSIFQENPGQVACVIMEPVGLDAPEVGFLQEVRDLTHENGALLIFDEVITGFRFALGGAQEYFNVVPDLACFGKAMGNGFPISAIVGRKEVMKLFEEVFYSFTFGGEIVSIAAALATIQVMQERKVIHYLWKRGGQLKDGFQALIQEFQLSAYIECAGYPPRTVIFFRDALGNEDLLLKSLFQQECLKRGIMFNGGHNICFRHTLEDIEKTLADYRTIFEILKIAISNDAIREMIQGEPVKPVFRKP